MDFHGWRRLIDNRMFAQFAITIEDAGIDDGDLFKAYLQDLSPDDYIDCIGNKYDLITRSEAGLSPLKDRFAMKS